MTGQLALTLLAVFASVALVTGAVIAFAMSRSGAASRRRLSNLVQERSSSTLILPPKEAALTSAPDPFWDRVVKALPTSRGSVKRLQRELSIAGIHSSAAAASFSIAELVLPVAFAAPALMTFEGMAAYGTAVVGAVAGYMAPGLILGRRVALRKIEIQNGLADALDLFVLCLEAGSSLDQAIVKTGEELDVAYPALGEQLRILISEMRAGKPRTEAFRGFAARTQVDDVRALVSMLVQTDRFGTSIAQALRTHSEVCRTKRRQRAEEKAQKVSVKLVFPLVFFLFPALYVVILGPAFIQFINVFK